MEQQIFTPIDNASGFWYEENPDYLCAGQSGFVGTLFRGFVSFRAFWILARFFYELLCHPTRNKQPEPVRCSTSKPSSISSSRVVPLKFLGIKLLGIYQALRTKPVNGQVGPCSSTPDKSLVSLQKSSCLIQIGRKSSSHSFLHVWSQLKNVISLLGSQKLLRSSNPLDNVGVLQRRGKQQRISLCSLTSSSGEYNYMYASDARFWIILRWQGWLKNVMCWRLFEICRWTNRWLFVFGSYRRVSYTRGISCFLSRVKGNGQGHIGITGLVDRKTPDESARTILDVIYSSNRSFTDWFVQLLEPARAEVAY